MLENVIFLVQYFIYFADFCTPFYLVDLEDNAVSNLQPNYGSHANWTVEAEFEFLDPSASHPVFRALYLPFLSRRFTKYNRYLLLRRVSPRRIVPSED